MSANAGSVTLGAYNIFDLREQARRFLPRGVFEYVERGTEDELGLQSNLAAFERVKLVPRVLRDVSSIDQTVDLFGKPMSMPVAIGATGAAGFVWLEGDLALATAAAACDVPFTISSASTLPIEKIVTAGGRLWFQLYRWEDRAMTDDLVKRANNLGCEALVVTVDTAVPPNREYNLRNGFGVPLRMNGKNVPDVLAHPRWLFKVLLPQLLRYGIVSQANVPAHLRTSLSKTQPIGTAFRSDDLTWDELKRLRDLWRGQVIVKGVVSPDDAARMAQEGIDAVIVSNHGGRNLDSTVATLDALPAVVKAVAGRIPVLVDSGIRRGSDVVKALALGAKAVLVGRVPLYGLGAAGRVGVERAMQLLREEVHRTMAFCGCRSVSEIESSLIHRSCIPSQE